MSDISGESEGLDDEELGSEWEDEDKDGDVDEEEEIAPKLDKNLKPKKSSLK